MGRYSKQKTFAGGLLRKLLAVLGRGVRGTMAGSEGISLVADGVFSAADIIARLISELANLTKGPRGLPKLGTSRCRPTV